jgi:hypothetical protein
MPEANVGLLVLVFLLKYFALPVAAFIATVAVAEGKARNV